MTSRGNSRTDTILQSNINNIPAGATGATGAQGIQGNIGATGIQGNTGPTGPSGGGGASIVGDATVTGATVRLTNGNTIGPNATNGVIFGTANEIVDWRPNCTISGGSLNTITGVGSWHTIAGGRNNQTSGDSSTISGGQAHRATAIYSTISGGNNNSAGGSASTIAGGNGNRIYGNNSVVSGGVANSCGGGNSCITGGNTNTVGFNSGCSILGGLNNTAAGAYSAILGGYNNATTNGYNGCTTIGKNCRANKTAQVVIGLKNSLTTGVGTSAVTMGFDSGQATRGLYLLDNPTSASAGTVLHIDGTNKVFGFSSSQRYKTQITDLDQATADKVLQLRAVKYKPIEEPDRVKDIYGLIAEEVDVILPSLVVEKNGVPETVSYDGLVPLLIKKIQELEARVVVLESAP
jgi:hypothetical protein